MTESVTQAQEFAARLGAGWYRPTVTGSERLTASMRRLRLTDPGLAELQYVPGQDLMVTVEGSEQAAVRRRYTIRALDRSSGTVTIDVLDHGGGPGARWAAGAVPGQAVEVIAPRGKVTLAPDAGWHLFAGDHAFLPAAFAMAESLPATARALLVLEVGPDDEQPLTAPACPGGPAWADPDGRPHGQALLAALAGLALPEGPGHAYLGGELRLVADLRRLLEERGLAREQISPKGYWRAGTANASHGEPPKD